MDFETELERSAYHEAGHAVMASRLGGQVVLVSIEPANDGGPRRHGETVIRWPATHSSEKQAQNGLFAVLAGPVAEIIFADEHYEPRLIAEWKADWLEATRLASQLRPDLTGDLLQAWIGTRFFQLIEFFRCDENWDRVATVADHLLAHEILETDLIDELCDDGWL